MFSSPEQYQPLFQQKPQSLPYQTSNLKDLDDTAYKTLKECIEERLSSSKKYTNSKSHQNSLFLSEQQNESLGEGEELKLVLENQSYISPGFYEYPQWQKLHALWFSWVDRIYLEDLWKILRLINYGEVLIPTGLVYEIMMEVRFGKEIGGFEKVINEFLRQNGANDSIKSIKELKNYTSISIIEKKYKRYEDNQVQSHQKVVKRYERTDKNVFDRNFSEAKDRAWKRVNSMCKGVVDEIKRTYSKPKISHYKSECNEGLTKPERVCHHPEKHQWKTEDQKLSEESHNAVDNLFKAKQISPSLFEGNVDTIPGVVNHLSRNRYSQMEKLRVKRELEKPNYSKKRIF